MQTLDHNELALVAGGQDTIKIQKPVPPPVDTTTYGPYPIDTVVVRPR